MSDAVRFGQMRLARNREQESAWRAIEQRCIDGLFEILDLPGYRRR
jgi:hypothetical protein